MSIRIYYEQRGWHIHCRVFTGKAKNQTHAKAGDLVFSADEWPDVHDRLLAIADVIPEGTPKNPNREWQGA